MALGLLALAGCKEDKQKATVLAQVGNASLTLEELRESFPAEFEQLIRREQYLDFIKRWIDDEVVYQQAQRAKLDADPEVKRKLAKLGRRVLIEEFLAREHAAEVYEPDEMAMTQYYEMHKEDFRRKTPEVKYAHIRAPTARQAQEIRAKLTGDNFLALSSAHSLDPTPESIESMGYKRLSEIPPCLAKGMAEARIGTVTQPIACPDGAYLVRLLERQEAGSAISFGEAKEEIGGILAMERKHKQLESRIAKYREETAINYHLDHIPGLAEAPAPAAPMAEIPQPVEPAPKAAAPAKPKPRIRKAAPAAASDSLPAKDPAPADPHPNHEEPSDAETP